MTEPRNYSTVIIHVKDGAEVFTRMLPGGQAVLELAPYGLSVIIHGRAQAEALWDALEAITMAYREAEAQQPYAPHTFPCLQCGVSPIPWDATHTTCGTCQERIVRTRPIPNT